MSGSVRSINDPTYFQAVTDFYNIRGGNVKFCGLYSVSFSILRILHFSCPTKVPFLDPVKNLRGLPFYILQHPNLLIYSTQTVYKAVVEIHNTWNTLALNSNTNIIQTLNTDNTNTQCKCTEGWIIMQTTKPTLELNHACILKPFLFCLGILLVTRSGFVFTQHTPLAC